jgi:hypothetical protein
MGSSVSGIFSGFIFGVIGFYIFRKGKVAAEYDLIFIGITMMIYPYFTTGPWIDWFIGSALCALAYYRPFR